MPDAAAETKDDGAVDVIADVDCISADMAVDADDATIAPDVDISVTVGVVMVTPAAVDAVVDNMISFSVVVIVFVSVRLASGIHV
jgi:hypothetical protein